MDQCRRAPRLTRESQWIGSFRQSEIAPPCSHRGPDLCDAHYENARKTGPCAWPSATTNRRSPLIGTLRSRRPTLEDESSSIVRRGAVVPRSRLLTEWATSQYEQSQSRESRARNSERADGAS